MKDNIEKATADYQSSLEKLRTKAPDFAGAFPNELAASVVRPQLHKSETPRKVKMPAEETVSRQASDKPVLKGFGYLYLRGNIWWIRYSVRGKDFRESSGSEKDTNAMRLLKRRWQEVGKGRFIGPQEDRVRMDDLFDAVKVDYENNGKRSTAALEARLHHLRGVFGGRRAIDVTEDRIELYKAARLSEKTERRGGKTLPSTVNRELAILRRAFRLAVRQKRISGAPTIELLEENNVRQGFVEPADFEDIVGNLPEHLQDFSRFAYTTGCRKGELQTLAWADVNRETQMIEIRQENTKNKEPHRIPLVDELAEIIERRWQARVIQNLDGTTGLAEFVFHCGDGRPVGEFRKSWKSACKKAGMPGILFHDLRRSAVRNLDRDGISQVVAMKITGHKTDSVYRRYRIVIESDMREALQRVQVANARKKERHVVAISKVKEGRR